MFRFEIIAKHFKPYFLHDNSKLAATQTLHKSKYKNAFEYFSIICKAWIVTQLVFVRSNASFIVKFENVPVNQWK